MLLAERLVGEARSRRARKMAPRERVVLAVSGGLFVLAAFAIALLVPNERDAGAARDRRTRHRLRAGRARAVRVRGLLRHRRAARDRAHLPARPAADRAAHHRAGQRGGDSPRDVRGVLAPGTPHGPAGRLLVLHSPRDSSRSARAGGGRPRRRLDLPARIPRSARRRLDLDLRARPPARPAALQGAGIGLVWHCAGGRDLRAARVPGDDRCGRQPGSTAGARPHHLALPQLRGRSRGPLRQDARVASRLPRHGDAALRRGRVRGQLHRSALALGRRAGQRRGRRARRPSGEPPGARVRRDAARRRQDRDPQGDPEQAQPRSPTASSR